jgi:hypothetical protein
MRACVFHCVYAYTHVSFYACIHACLMFNTMYAYMHVYAKLGTFMCETHVFVCVGFSALSRINNVLLHASDATMYVCMHACMMLFAQLARMLMLSAHMLVIVIVYVYIHA